MQLGMSDSPERFMSSTTKNAVSDTHSRRQDTAESREQQFGRYFGTQLEIMDDLDLFVSVLPPAIREVLEAQPDLKELFEVVLDLGRPPEARFASRVMDLSDEPVTQAQIDQVVARVGDFGKDNRAGIERTLHRISAIRNRQGRIIGLTCRVGRAVFGTIDIIRDVVESGKSFFRCWGVREWARPPSCGRWPAS